MLELRKRVRGLFVKLPATEIVDIVAGAGLDFALVDLEHSQLSEGDAFRLVAHARALGLPALVRIPAVDRGLVNRLLEAGAAGLQLSTVRRGAQIEELRASCRYAPAGRRSISLGHAAARYGALSLADYLAAQGDGPLVVAQIETAETDEPLDALLAARPDVAFVGATDLTVDLGLDGAKVAARIAEIADAAEAAGIPLGGVGLDDPRVRYDVVGTDVGVLAKGVAALA
jgi:4-hydroxy-2-oxoheptanedioate aldolase